MALPILDGNQTSTTLATTVSGGAHYPNHIIAQAVTIGSLPSISGSVTISNAITISSLPALAGGTNRIGVVTIGAGTVTIGAGTSQIGSVTASISGTVTVNGGDFNQSILDALNNYGANANEKLPTITTLSDPLPSGSNVIGQVQLYSSSVALSTGGNRIGVVTASLSAGTAQIGSVTASISGTPSVTFTAITGSTSIIGTPSVTFTAITGSVSILGTPSVTMGAIAGAVTMYGSNVNGGIVIPSLSDLNESPDARSGNALLVKIMDNVGNQNVPLTNTLLRATAVTIAGTVTANLSSVPTHGVTLTSTTVTVSTLPSGALTTRFGSVTTANTVVASTAVTNTSRKYLLVQNNQTGTSAGAATIGIGFTPTTTQGIQLTAGASYVADSFVPTGAVYWLGSVTGAVFTIVEG